MIPTFTAPPPVPIYGTPDFEQRARDYTAWWAIAHAELGAAVALLGPLAIRSEAMVSMAHPKGLWNTLETGVISRPALVVHNDRAYYLVTAEANVPADVPGVSNKWAQVVTETPQQFTTAANLANPSPTITFGESTGLSTFRDVEFVFQDAQHNNAAARHITVQASSDGVTWTTAQTISAQALTSAFDFNGYVRIKNRGERTALLEALLRPENAGAPTAQASGRVLLDLTTPSGVKHVRFGLSDTGNFVSGVVKPEGIGAPYV